jgi:hypothetical protein
MGIAYIIEADEVTTTPPYARLDSLPGKPWNGNRADNCGCAAMNAIFIDVPVEPVTTW